MLTVLCVLSYTWGAPVNNIDVLRVLVLTIE